MKKSYFTMKSKFLKSLVLSLGLIFASATPTFAAENTMVLTSQTQSNAQVLLEKQKEIDKYVFEDHAQEITNKGFSVTHTGIVNDSVEVGIIPFTKENEDYLYNAFGTDKVKIIEGVIATTVMVDENTSTNSKLSPVIFSAIGLLGLGVVSLVIFRKKPIK
jgi:hypothetical protein